MEYSSFFNYKLRDLGIESRIILCQKDGSGIKNSRKCCQNNEFSWLKAVQNSDLSFWQNSGLEVTFFLSTHPVKTKVLVL